MDAEAEIKVAQAMLDYARALRDSEDPDTAIAAAQEEKHYIEKLATLRRRRKPQPAGAGGE